MIKKVYLYLRQRPVVVALLVIFFFGVFLRAYHFSDWLHFELDQSRDAKVIDLAIEEGPSNLPLLGPKAAGTFLRLGPLFYYFKYLSALVFGDTPSGMAVIIMLFGILAIPVFYLFIKRYFEERLSLGLTLLFSVSIFLVMYSRFSWNPNPLPFFVILTFYALLRAADKADKNEKRRGIWLLISAFALTVSTQLHFLAFVAVPAIAFIFLAIKRPKIRIKYWIGAILIILVLYSPAIVNDLETGGDNIGQLMKVISQKSAKEDHNLVEKVVKNYEENSLGHFVLISGLQKGELPRVTINKKGLNTLCDEGCKTNLPLGIMALVLFTAGFMLLFKNVFSERDSRRKDFLILNSIWLVIVFGLYISIAYDISPRFFLLVAALPFVFLGLTLEFIGKKWPKIGVFSLVAIIALLFLTNLREIKKRFWQMKNAPYQAFEIPADRILKEKNRVTLKQQYLIIDYILGRYEKNKFPIYLNSEPYYRRSFLYHLAQREIPSDDFRNSTGSQKVYAEGNYFLIYPTPSNLDKELGKYDSAYKLKEKKEFGTLTVFELAPKPEAVNANRQEFELKGKPKSAPGVPVRYRWEEIFNDSANDESDN